MSKKLTKTIVKMKKIVYHIIKQRGKGTKEKSTKEELEKNEKTRNRWRCKRERERESNRLIKLGFVCDAKKVVKNNYINVIKKIEYCVKTKREICTIHSTLSFCI